MAGTAWHAKSLEEIPDAELLPDFETVRADKRAYARSFALQYENTDPIRGRRLAEGYGVRGYVVQNPPAMPLSQREMDEVYDLPYMRAWHPMYDKEGGIPAFSEVRFSLTSSRGCFGSCSFCALAFHQGRIVQSRSHGSILNEAKRLTEDPLFKGYIHDVGGPTADFRFPACDRQLKKGACPKRQCLFPSPCKNLKAGHRDYLELLRKLRALPGSSGSLSAPASVRLCDGRSGRYVF